MRHGLRAATCKGELESLAVLGANASYGQLMAAGLKEGEKSFWRVGQAGGVFCFGAKTWRVEQSSSCGLMELFLHKYYSKPLLK